MRDLIPTMLENKSEEIYIIKEECPLCEEYILCEGCPFERISCERWIWSIIREKFDKLIFEFGFRNIYWFKENNKEARRQLKYLRKRAKELIEWV